MALRPTSRHSSVIIGCLNPSKSSLTPLRILALMKEKLSMRRAVSLLALMLLTFGTFPAVGLAAGFNATPVDQFSTLDGFEVELIYEVPGETQGSWVSLTVDPQGRLLACDQYGGLYRIDVSESPAKVEKLDIEFTGAQGLLCAFGALYANVNFRERGAGDTSGVWRLTDTDGDDQYDTKEHILPLNGGTEHGPHAMVLTPDGSRILLCAGNNTNLPSDLARSRVPRNWSEDHLLGRMPDARGHNADRLAPGGFILSMNPDGQDIELIATGFRNEYDIALNREGELFAYDADMEWDVGTPWYRPTRINHVISGAEFGWRNGTGKWPAYYPDSFGSAVDIGPGSPTGICFGYGTSFPKKYQDALFICDWSYGNIHAVHLTPDGSSYGGSYETFATAAPLPVTDITVHPDGALYFTIGGRRTQSALYRIRYTGPTEQQDAAAQTIDAAATLRGLRHEIEATHTAEPSSENLALTLKHLGHEDRGVRFAARIGLEHQPVDQWRDTVVGLDDPQARTLGVIALARNGAESDRAAAVEALTGLNWDELSGGVRIDLLRAYGLVAIRLGEIADAERASVLEQIGGKFPTQVNEVDRELAQVLVYLQAADSIGKIVAEMQRSPSQENQIHYAMTLRGARDGWNRDLHRQYFQWFNDIQSARGGMSFGGFIENIKKAALERVPERLKKNLAAVIDAPKIESDPAADQRQRPLIKQWTVDDLSESVATSARHPNFERGREVFAAAQCYKCHRMGVQGGILGPDLTAAGGRFNPRDLLVSIIEPSKEISDQYGSTQFLMDDGSVVVGRVVNMNGDKLQVMTNMLDPSQLAGVDRSTIDVTRPSPTSMMPSGLVDTFNEEEIADLVAYLRAGGRVDHPIYRDRVAQYLVFPGGNGPGAGKHIVLIAGDHEYRSEEALPQLGKILSVHQGFKCTVLFPIDPVTGEINPDSVTNIPGLEALDSADLIILGLRFRNLEDDQMQRILDYAAAGRPMMALRTSTHPFNIPPDSQYSKYSWNNKDKSYLGGFGKQVFGETWVSHHGKHGSESTRGLIADAAHVIASGIADGDIWGPTDVYEVTLPLSGDGHAIVNGQILSGMNPDDAPVVDDRNDPMMPVAWTRSHNGGRVFVTTMGSADDLPSEGVRRMLVNAAFWCLGMEGAVQPDLDVSIVGDFRPTPFGFRKFIPGKRPADYDL